MFSFQVQLVCAMRCDLLILMDQLVPATCSVRSFYSDSSIPVAFPSWQIDHWERPWSVRLAWIDWLQPTQVYVSR